MSSLKLGLFVLPVSIVVVLIGLIGGNVVIAVVGIALAVGDLLLCATGFLTARRSHRRGA